MDFEIDVEAEALAQEILGEIVDLAFRQWPLRSAQEPVSENRFFRVLVLAGADEQVEHAGIVRQIAEVDGVGQALSLLRFYALHVVMVPLAVLALSMVHFYRVRKNRGVLPYL